MSSRARRSEKLDLRLTPDAKTALQAAEEGKGHVGIP